MTREERRRILDSMVQAELKNGAADIAWDEEDEQWLRESEADWIDPEDDGG